MSPENLPNVGEKLGERRGYRFRLKLGERERGRENNSLS